MSFRDLEGTRAIVTGASRGFGRATAIALAERGVHVVGVARTESKLDELATQLGASFTAHVADAADSGLPAELIARFRPQALVLNAGATPTPAPLSEQTWETFGANWDVDVKHVFNFTRHALLTPLDPGSVVISLSSGAALNGSPMSGGYAGAKATIRFMSAYARTEALRHELRIRFVAVLPVLTPATDLDRLYTSVYASETGLSEESFLDRFGGPLTVDTAGRTIGHLVTDDSLNATDYVLSRQGLKPIG